MLKNVDNVIHQLFLELGCDLDYVPQQKYEAFTMGLQFVAGLVFWLVFVHFLYKLMCSFLNWR